MNRLGFIHDKLDIKILILFILQRIPGALTREQITDIVLSCDNAIDYFDFIACLTELTESGHITEDKAGYTITDKGVSNGSTIESSLPYTARSKALKYLAPIATAMKRDALIKSSIDHDKDGSLQLRLSLSDGISDLMSLRIVVASEEQAVKIEKGFRKNAETYYQRIMDILLE